MPSRGCGLLGENLGITLREGLAHSKRGGPHLIRHCITPSGAAVSTDMGQATEIQPSCSQGQGWKPRCLQGCSLLETQGGPAPALPPAPGAPRVLRSWPRHAITTQPAPLTVFPVGSTLSWT